MFGYVYRLSQYIQGIFQQVTTAFFTKITVAFDRGRYSTKIPPKQTRLTEFPKNVKSAIIAIEILLNARATCAKQHQSSSSHKNLPGLFFRKLKAALFYVQ